MYLPSFLFVLVLPSSVCGLPATSQTREYCATETFEASCPDGDVILMTSARYGRMRLGRCIREDFGYIGCWADALTLLDVKCSGRQTCNIAVADPDLVRLEPCHRHLPSYLEASYECVPESRQCPVGEVSCPNGPNCVPPWFLCDGDDDCGDGSDEDPKYCSMTPMTCERGHFACATIRRCVPSTQVCDGYDQCGDSSDEDPIFCGNNVRQCNIGEVKCPHNARCIPVRYVCDGDNDCGDNTDEDESWCRNIPAHCGDDEVRCRSRPVCISRTYVCDGYDDCGDLSDEDVSICPAVSCRTGYFACATTRRCISNAWLCDGDDDCDDNSDENPAICSAEVLMKKVLRGFN